MVCIYCAGQTRVANSRLQIRSNTIWRRRSCASCKAVFTTSESPELGGTVMVRQKAGNLAPFSRDQLFLSVYESCRHRTAAVSDAKALTDTVIAKLLPHFQTGTVPVETIRALAIRTLLNFDAAASTHYTAFHPL